MKVILTCLAVVFFTSTAYSQASQSLSLPVGSVASPAPFFPKRTVKTAVLGAYTALKAFWAEMATNGGCLAQIGFVSQDVTIGFNDEALLSPVCGASGDQPCNGISYGLAGNIWASCDPGEGTSRFDPHGLYGKLSLGTLTRDTFSVVGIIPLSNNKAYRCEINEQKEMSCGEVSIP